MLMPEVAAMDFDFKRKPFEPRDDADGLLTFQTLPWEDVDEWRPERERHQRWKAKGCALKTLDDWLAFRGIRRRHCSTDSAAKSTN
jgi:hypothetical protein